MREDEHTRLIMDTKWKRLDKRRTNLGVSQADLYQLYAYAQRYNCADVVLLYPWHEALTTRERQFLIEPVENAFTAERRLWIKTVELAVPKRLPALMKNLIDSITGRVSVVPG